MTFLLALLAVGCKDKRAPQPQGGRQWKTMTVKRGDTEVTQLFTASIQGRQDIEIRAQVQGKIVSVNVKEGQEVKRGQTLFAIDAVPYRAALAQATAQVHAAQAAAATAKLDYEGKKHLFDHKVVSAHELQTAYNAWADAQAQVALARAAEQSARNNLSYTTVTSPNNGVVGMLPFRQGALVGPETAQALTTISDNSEMYVYFSIDETQLLTLLRRYGSTDEAIRRMAPVGLQMSDGGAYEAQGRVASISGVINRSTGSVAVRADFPNPHRLLHTGATGNVVMTNRFHNVVIIPQTSTVTLQDKLIVYRVVGGKAVSTAISVNAANDGRNYIVTSGLNVGDVIIADGAGMVQEGMEVK